MDLIKKLGYEGKILEKTKGNHGVFLDTTYKETSNIKVTTSETIASKAVLLQ